MPDIDLPFDRAEYAAKLNSARKAMAARGIGVIGECADL